MYGSLAQNRSGGTSGQKNCVEYCLGFANKQAVAGSDWKLVDLCAALFHGTLHERVGVYKRFLNFRRHRATFQTMK